MLILNACKVTEDLFFDEKDQSQNCKNDQEML